ncbi:MAG: osmoprotectant transport system substrate-binding protein [Solirubrobacteraceae bacterium]|nr:osmoprotectant transport system substrate-binding protein [Solirubrobacteraceae bacterium]
MNRSIARMGLVAVAALSAAMVMAGCGSSSSSGSAAASGPGKGKPPVTIGDKNFTEEYILGELYAQALRAKGYRVSVKSNIGSSEIIDKALTTNNIQMYPDYVGTILSVVAHQNNPPQSAAATYQAAKRFEETRGYTLLDATPFSDTNAVATLPAFATAHKLKTIGDLKKVGSFTYADTPENLNRLQGVAGLRRVYGLTRLKFTPLAIGLQYLALKSGKAQTADVFSTDAQLTQTKLTILADDKHIFGFQNVAPVVSQRALRAEGPAFAQTINAVSAKLTLPAVQSMNAAVALDKQAPAAVAGSFLKANGLD